jgi:carboxyl-terminal processing protease
VKVVAPIEDTPAFRAGVKAGDLIIKLDETNVKGMTLNDAVKRMRGKPNTDITLTIIRKGDPKPKIVTLTRAVIQIQSVKNKLIEPGYAYVRVTQFQEHTPEKLAAALDSMWKQSNGQVKGMILDLRNDPGGLLNAAVAISAAFLPQNALVVYTDGRTEDSKMRLYASSEYYLRGSKEDYLKKLPASVKTVPMVVLVNGGSASASEIVAGALQDHKRAIIMGTQTFGKGSVQTILPLGNNTAIKLTTARYYTPNGRSIQAKGIVPDIPVEEATIAEVEPALRMRESDLERHLSNPTDKDNPDAAPEAAPKPAPKPSTDKGAENKGDKPEPAEIGSKGDYQLNQALNLLKGLQIISKR